MALITIEMYPTEEFPISLSWADNVDTTITEFIQTPTVWDVSPATGLELSDPQVSGTKTYIWFREGATPGIYRVFNHVAVNQVTTPYVRDKTFSQEFQIVVKE